MTVAEQAAPLVRALELPSRHGFITNVQSVVDPLDQLRDRVAVQFGRFRVIGDAVHGEDLYRNISSTSLRSPANLGIVARLHGVGIGCAPEAHPTACESKRVPGSERRSASHRRPRLCQEAADLRTQLEIADLPEVVQPHPIGVIQQDETRRSASDASHVAAACGHDRGLACR